MALRKILLVDDDESFLETVQRLLISEGYYVETANTGKEALSKLVSTEFHVVILDIALPDIRGDDIVSELRSMNNEIGVILITGFSHLQKSIDTIQLGIIDILLKPTEPKEIFTALELAFQPKPLDHSQTQPTRPPHISM